MSGLDLLAALRRDGVLAPAVLITSIAPPQVRLGVKAARVESVEKPLLDDELARHVLQLIRGQPG
jgi:FixJ family two-component response regulator